MAGKTNYLSLILPANNEYSDTWDVPMNKNFVTIDEEFELIGNELQAARFTKTSLAEFLAVGHLSNGELKPSPEVDAARNSPVYGDDDGTGTDNVLKTRLDQGDREIWDARENMTSLQAALARRARDFDYPDTVYKGAQTAENQPNFLTASGSEFQLNGNPTPVEFNIDGYYYRINSDETVNVTGGDGIRYLYAQKPASPIVLVDGSTGNNGITTINAGNSDKVQVFKDSTKDFVALGLQPGVVIEVLNTDNAGQYIVEEVGFDGNNDELKIIGIFVNVIGSINYNILDPIKPEFGVDTTYAEVDGKCYIGEANYVSGALIGGTVISYNFKRKYESQFEAIDVSSSPTFEEIYNHNLGALPKKVWVYASQASDGSLPIEPLSFAIVNNDLGVSVNNTIAYTPGVFDPGTGDSTYTDGSLGGTVTASITGSVYNLKSVIVKVTKTQIFVKNPTANHFYRDYDGTDQDTGYLKVVCEK
jgi:hypothetical protein